MTREAQEYAREKFVLCYDHAQLTADLSVKLLEAQAKFRVVSVQYVNPTGLAADAANYFNIKVNQAAVVIANWSTETGEEGTIAADTFVDLVMGTDFIVEAGEELDVEFDETGTATLPPGRIIINCEYL